MGPGSHVRSGSRAQLVTSETPPPQAGETVEPRTFRCSEGPAEGHQVWTSMEVSVPTEVPVWARAARGNARHARTARVVPATRDRALGFMSRSLRGGGMD